MRIPAKLSFSASYRNDGICGEFGSTDQGSSELSDMAQAYTTRARGFGEGRVGKRALDLEVRAWVIKTKNPINT